MKIAVVGLGKLGAVIAAVYAETGNTVVGYDINAAAVADINAGKAPIAEPGLQELIDRAGSNLTATTSISAALDGAEVSYVIVPTPSDLNGVFINDFVRTAVNDIGRCLYNANIRHTVIICSTVMPGSCDGELSAVLQASSGKVVGEDVGLVYSPEFIALGSVVRDMHYPDLILIGESDTESGEIAEQMALSVVRNSPRVHRMNLVNAEITKISINTFVTTKISFANMLSEICDQMPGGDVDIVTTAVGSDSRIGIKYLKGALGYGGPCFPRDNLALTRLAERLGLDATIAKATDVVNERQASRVIELVKSVTAIGATVAVLGLAYKPDTPVCDRSQGIDIANGLVLSGFGVLVHDPQAQGAAAADLHPKIKIADSLESSISAATTIIIATPWPEYALLGHQQLGNKFVVDPWGILNREVSAARLGKLSAAGVMEGNLV